MTQDISFRQEHEADLWAARWILEELPDDDRQGYFRLFAISVALTWLVLVDDVRRTSTTHPHAWQRLNRLSDAFPVDDLNPAFEMASYVVKVLLLPDHEIVEMEVRCIRRGQAA